jgi:uncharacterized protein DUF262/uncharacterized protein DUF1524
VTKTANPTPPLHAEALSIRQLFALGQFEPARAQRDYQWEEEQWRALLNDLTAAFTGAGLDPDAGKQIGVDAEDGPPPAAPAAKPAPPPKKLRAKRAVSSYYLGHMLLQPRPLQGEPGFYIYDGQQRLTTLTLMLCALRDTPGGMDVWNTIQTTVRTPPPFNRPRLSNPTSGGALNHILKLNGIKARVAETKFEPADRRMYRAARFFLANTQDWSPERWKAFTDFLLDRVHVTVTRTADRHLLEFAYVTINTRGKPLETKDIIKGHFSHLASRHSLMAANSMSTKWDQLERKSGYHLDQILRMGFLLDFHEKPSFDFTPQLMDHFSDESFAEAEEWVGVRLPALADLHKRCTRDVTHKDVLAATDADLRRLTFLPWKHWQAVVFAFAQRDASDPARYAKSIAGLVRWAFIVNLIDVDDDRILDNVVQAIVQIQGQYDPFDFRQRGVLAVGAKWRKRALTRLQDGQIADKYRRGAHVRWTETLFWPPSEVDFRATEKTNVEHVLPKRPGGQWLKHFPEQAHIYAEKFGNLCLLPEEVNTRLYDGQYPDKRPALLKLAPHYRSALDVAQSPVWDPAAVDARTQRLAEMAASALSLK